MWNTDHKWDTYWFGLLCSSRIFMDILAVLPGCFAITVWGWRTGVGHGVLPLHDQNRVKTHSPQRFSLTTHWSRAVSRCAVLSVHIHSLSSTHSVCSQPVLLVPSGISPASVSNGSACFASVRLYPLCSDALPAICCCDALCVDISPLLSHPPSPLIPHSCTYCPPRFPSITCYHLSACAFSHSLISYFIIGSASFSQWVMGFPERWPS